MTRWRQLGALLTALLVLPASHAAVDPRSHELVRLDCRSGLSRRETTLFENGTLRLRELPGDGLVLRELTPEELHDILARLAREDLGEVKALPTTVDGAWIERCELWLDLVEGRPRHLAFGRLDTLPLALARVLAVVDELGRRAEDTAEANRQASELPADYYPQAGDVLVKRDGKRFRVVTITVDKRGVELAGQEQPVTIYLALTELRGEFVSLEKRELRW